MRQARKALTDRQKELELKTQQLEMKLSNKIEEDIKKARRKSTQAGQSQGSMFYAGLCCLCMLGTDSFKGLFLYPTTFIFRLATVEQPRMINYPRRLYRSPGNCTFSRLFAALQISIFSECVGWFPDIL